MKRGKKRKKRKRGVASRKRVENQTTLVENQTTLVENQPTPIPEEVEFQHLSKEKKQRVKELEDEKLHIFEKVISRYKLSSDQVSWLEYEFKLGLSVIADSVDATHELEDLYSYTYDSETLSEMVHEIGESEEYWRASFDLANELGLSTVNIDDDGNITGKRIDY